MNKKTLVLGASDNPERYSNIAIHRLLNHNHEVLAIGAKATTVAGVPVVNDRPALEVVHTVTLYLNPERQKAYYDYILSLHPQRIIFNPGTENEELAALAQEQKIDTIEACTLVMLATGQY
jgi:uncharacterized protein